MSQALARLLQLASPALPVGAYSYSQGLEWAAESCVVRDEASALTWIGDLLEWNMGRFEAPLLAQMLRACRAQDCARLAQLNARYLASRESAELRAETLQMGYSLLRLLSELGDEGTLPLELARNLDAPTFPTVWACVTAAWQIENEPALTAYLWSWVENQTMAAIKAVPLGQAAGQRMMLALGNRIALIVERAQQLPDADFSNFAPAFAIACCQHETQYSRLFRS
jgi:urease accessory protein